MRLGEPDEGETIAQVGKDPPREYQETLCSPPVLVTTSASADVTLLFGCSTSCIAGELCFSSATGVAVELAVPPVHNISHSWANRKKHTAEDVRHELPRWDMSGNMVLCRMRRGLWLLP